MTDKQNTVREALIAFQKEEISAEDVRNRYDDVDGIERAIAASRAKRNRSMSDEELDNLVELDDEFPG